MIALKIIALAVSLWAACALACLLFLRTDRRHTHQYQLRTKTWSWKLKLAMASPYWVAGITFVGIRDWLRKKES